MQKMTLEDAIKNVGLAFREFLSFTDEECLISVTIYDDGSGRVQDDGNNGERLYYFITLQEFISEVEKRLTEVKDENKNL